MAHSLRWLDDARALLAEAVQRRHVAVDALERELAASPRGGSQQLKAALQALGIGAQSNPEIDLLQLVCRAGFPEPLCNRDLVVNGEWLARPDFRWGRVIVEVDSREWHSDVESWRRTLARHNLLTQLGFIVLHITPTEIRREPQRVIATIRETLIAAGELSA